MGEGIKTVSIASATLDKWKLHSGLASYTLQFDVIEIIHMTT